MKKEKKNIVVNFLTCKKQNELWYNLNLSDWRNNPLRDMFNFGYGTLTGKRSNEYV